MGPRLPLLILLYVMLQQLQWLKPWHPMPRLNSNITMSLRTTLFCHQDYIQHWLLAWQLPMHNH
jgi:hypothetical protein